MAPDRAPLDAAARAVADGEAVDWERLESSVGKDDRASIRHLRIVARVADVHRSVQVPGAGSSATLPTQSRATVASISPRWGPLVLLERIGGGAYGDVYRARDPRLDREVALKLLRSAPPSDASRSQEVIGEARLLARVRHPHVVTVHGADRFDGRVGLWMEFIRGRSLAREVLERGPLGAQEAAVIGLDVCAGLAAVHKAGLVHRDIKAGNVMREEAGRIVLMDFGAGYAYADPAESNAAGFAGTPLYAAPEVLAGQPATPSSDLYGLGVLLYFLVTGSYPVAGATIDGLRDAHARGARRPLRDARPDLPGPFIAVVERALEAEPRSRFPSAGAMESALAGVLVQGTGENAQPPASASVCPEPAVAPPRKLAPFVPRSFRGRAAVLAAAAVLVAGGALGYRNWPRTGEAGAALGFQSRDWVLITAFDNRTGNSKLDGTVEYALERELGNSRFVNIVPRERVGDALALMRKPPATRLDESTGREVCLRDGGIRAMVAGRVEKLGSVFDVSARIIDPASGRTLLAAAVDAPDEEHILAAVRDVSNRIRTGLGEARGEIVTTNQALEKVTTPSLKALRAYSEGMALIRVPGGGDTEWAAANALFEQATREDAGFASAYCYLSWSYWNPGPRNDRAKALAASDRAFQLSDRVTDRERLFIRGTYYQQRRQRNELRAEYEALVKLYPDDYWATNNLAASYLGSRESDKALPHVLRLTELRPKDPGWDVLAAGALIGLGRAGEAAAHLERALASRKSLGMGPTWDQWVECFPIWQRWASGDVTGAMAVLREMSALAEKEQDVHLRRALNVWFITLGRLSEADAFLLKDLAMIRRQPEYPARIEFLSDVPPEVLLAWNAELRGDRRAAKTWMQQLSARVKPDVRSLWWETTLLQARAGLDDEVRRWMAERSPAGLASREELVSWARGELALRAGHPAEAATLLTKALESLPKGYLLRFATVQALSSALEASRGPEAALGAIADNSSPLDRSPDLTLLDGSAWLDLEARRARLLRRLGRPTEAEPIEAELRKYLAYADSDLLIVKQLAQHTR